MNDPQGEGKEKIEQNKDAFLIAFDLLLKNSERYAGEVDEISDKLMLNKCLMIFLVNCSAFDCVSKFSI